MKIISYNVNGIRAAMNKGLTKWLKAADPDILCLQEIKAQKDQVEFEAFEQLGYHHHYWYSAQKKGVQWCGRTLKKRTKKRSFWYWNRCNGSGRQKPPTGL